MTTAPKISESVLQQHVRQCLGNLGYLSLATGVSRQKVECEVCHAKFYPTGWQGNDVALPDLLFYRLHPSFPAILVPFEMKTATGRIQPEQKRLIDDGRVMLARSIHDTVTGLLKVEAALNDYRFDPARRELMERFLRENDGRIG